MDLGVAHCFRHNQCALNNIIDHFTVSNRRRRKLNNFLKPKELLLHRHFLSCTSIVSPALDATLTLPQMPNLAILISENLDFYMSIAVYCCLL